jgi:outer membrane protein TolC
VWQRSLDVSTRLLRDVNAIRARGLASRSDSAQAEALFENDRRGLAEAEAQVEISRSGLARLLALPADRAVAATDRLQPGPAWGQDLLGTIRRSLQDRPSLAALEQQRQAQLAQVQLARAARLPSVGLMLGGGINANRINLPVLSTTTTVGLSAGPSITLPQQSAGASQSGSFYDWGALISLRQPLFDGGSARAATAVAQRQVEQQQIAIASAEQAIIQNVETWWQTHRATAAQITAAAAAARAGELAVRDAELRYRAGISPILEVLITQRDLQLARTALAVSIHRWNLSRAGLELETGAGEPEPGASTP